METTKDIGIIMNNSIIVILTCFLTMLLSMGSSAILTHAPHRLRGWTAPQTSSRTCVTPGLEQSDVSKLRPAYLTLGSLSSTSSCSQARSGWSASEHCSHCNHHSCRDRD